METPRCPPREELERLLDEKLDPADLGRISAHVAVCPACQKALEGLTADPGPESPSWRGLADDDSHPPHPDFLDRMKQVPPPVRLGRMPSADGPNAAPPSDGTVLLADDAQQTEPLPALDDYEILSMLGRGGEGVVYKAWHRPLGRLVALKMLRDADRAQPQALVRFRLEAETLARLRHPNIVQVYEVGSQDGRPFFAMEYVEGGPLSARLTGQPQPAHDSAALIEALALAVHIAHQAGILHRDLKPANILLQADRGAWGVQGADTSGPSLRTAPHPPLPTPKISDFGLAKRVQVETSLTRTGMVLGTPAYMAPEQARAEAKVVGPACDVYALGSILYHLLTGRPPFVGGQPMEVLLQVVHDEPVSLRRLFPQTPRDLETICLKCLHKEPRRRYGSAAALAEDLRRYLDGRPVLARPTALWEQSWKAARRRPATATLLAACAAALLLLVGGGAYYNARLALAKKISDENAQKAAERADAAKAAETKLGEEAAAARAAETRAADRAEEAKRQQALALNAYRRLVFDVQNSMRGKPGLIELKKKLLQTAVEGLREVVPPSQAAPAGGGRDQAQAAAHFQLATLFAEADDQADAEKEFAACRTIAEELARAGPHDAGVQDLLCRVCAGLGDVFKHAGRTDEAVAAYRKEIDHARAWLTVEPDSAAAHDRLNEAIDWAADAAMAAMKLDEVNDWNRRLRAAAEEWHKDDPKSIRARFYLSAADERRGRLLVIDGDLTAAREAFHKARVALDEVLAAEPADVTYTDASRVLDVDYGQTLWRMGDAAGALPHFQNVADYYWQQRASAADDPQDFVSELLASQSFTDCAVAHQRLFHFDEALTWYGRAFEPLAPFQSRPPSPDAAEAVRQRLAEIQARANYCKATVQALQDPSIASRIVPAADGEAILALRACVFLSQGRAEEAEKAADLMDATRPKNADEFYTLAVAYAIGAASVGPARAPDALSAEERALRKRFMDRAFAALDKAAEMGFKDVERLKNEPQLAPLRNERAYQALVERLESPKHP